MRLMIALFLLISLSVNSQDSVVIHGKVIANDERDLSNVRVNLDETGANTISDPCGQFEIRAPRGRSGVLHLSIFSHSYYFDLKKIQDKDLDKEVIFKLVNFDRDKEEEVIDITMECNKPVRQKVSFNISKKHTTKPKKK